MEFWRRLRAAHYFRLTFPWHNVSRCRPSPTVITGVEVPVVSPTATHSDGIFRHGQHFQRKLRPAIYNCQGPFFRAVPAVFSRVSLTGFRGTAPKPIL